MLLIIHQTLWICDQELPGQFGRNVGRGVPPMFEINIARWFDIPSLSLSEISPSEDLYVYHHLGLGDMIHLNGMVRYLLKELHPNCRIHVFCKERNAAMTGWMYRDEPRIQLECVRDGSNESEAVQRTLRERNATNYLSIGHRPLRRLERQYSHTFFDQLFYMQAGVPYDVRFSHCYWQRDMDEEERVYRKLRPGPRYAFVHDDISRGYVIDTDAIDMPIVRNDVTESIFHLGLLLEHATEVHCMESSIRCMIESLDMSHCRLFYHNFRYPDRPLGTATNHCWVQVDRTLAKTA
jgi:hypothetical protein